MAFPTQTSAVTNGSSATSTPTVNLPADVVAGDILWVLIRVAVAGAIGWPNSDWHEVFDASPDAADDQMACAWKLADGTEGGTTIQLSCTSGKFAALALAVRGCPDPNVTPPTLSTVATGSGTTPDPTTCNPGTAKDYLWLWMGGWADESTSPPTGDPANYSGRIGASSGTSGLGTTNCRVAMSFRENNASSEDPGSWTISISAAWTAYCVAFHPAPPAPAEEHYAESGLAGGVGAVARRAAAGLAATSMLAAGLAMAVANAPQDDPQYPAAPAEEDFWSQVTAWPVPHFQRPAGMRSGGEPAAPPEELHVEENEWWPVIWPTLPHFQRPVGARPGGVPAEAPPPAVVDDEPWVRFAPWPAPPRAPQPAIDLEEPGALHGPVEDYWQSRPPAVGTMRVALPLGDPDELPAGSLAGPMVEDYWLGGPAPTPGRTLVQLPLGDPEEVPAGSLHWNPDEEFAPPLARPWPATLSPRVLWGPDEDLVPPPAGGGPPDEDYWLRLAPWPVLPHFQRQAGGSGAPTAPPPTFEGGPDEDYWPLELQPTWPGSAVTLWFVDVEPVWLAPADADPWINPVPGARSNRIDLPLTDGDQLRVPPPQPLAVEDYWQNPAAPVGAQLRVALPLGDPEQTAPPTPFRPEEEPWAKPLIWPPAWFAPLSLEQDPRPSVAVLPPDEDFWKSSVAPAPGTMRVQLPLGDAEADVKVVPPALDEDFWRSGVNPAAGIVRVQLPLGDAEQTAPPLPLRPDEEPWNPPTVWPLRFVPYFPADEGAFPRDLGGGVLRVRVVGKVLLPSGAPGTTGRLSLALSRSGSAAGSGGERHRVGGVAWATIAEDGSVDFRLVPNEVLDPPGSTYLVTLTVERPGALPETWEERWRVASSPDPVDVGAIERVT